MGAVDAAKRGDCENVWVDQRAGWNFSKDLKYTNSEKHKYFIDKYDEVARMLSSMISNPEKFCP